MLSKEIIVITALLSASNPVEQPQKAWVEFAQDSTTPLTQTRERTPQLEIAGLWEWLFGTPTTRPVPGPEDEGSVDPDPDDDRDNDQDKDSDLDRDPRADTPSGGFRG